MINPSDQPLVSFIMAAKNFERFVGDAIASVMNQTYQNIELIVVDDASTDNTTSIIREWAERDARIRAIYNTTSVLPPRARNMAADIARGTYLAILDSDDISMPDRIEKQVAYMLAHPEIDASGSHAEIIDIDGKSFGIKKKSTNIADIRCAFLLQNQFIHSSMIIKKSVFDALGGYRSEYMYAEDYDLYSRVLEAGQMNNVDAVLIKFRASSGGVTTQSNSQKIQMASSLAVSQRNCAPYISISAENMKDLTDMMNTKDIPLMKKLRSIMFYRKLIKCYLDKNQSKLTAIEQGGISQMCRNKIKSVLIATVK